MCRRLRLSLPHRCFDAASCRCCRAFSVSSIQAHECRCSLLSLTTVSSRACAGAAEVPASSVLSATQRRNALAVNAYVPPDIALPSLEEQHVAPSAPMSWPKRVLMGVGDSSASPHARRGSSTPTAAARGWLSEAQARAHQITVWLQESLLLLMIDVMPWCACVGSRFPVAVSAAGWHWQRPGVRACGIRVYSWLLSRGLC